MYSHLPPNAGGFFMPSSRRNFVLIFTLLKDIMGYAMLCRVAGHAKGCHVPTYSAIEQLNNSNAASLKQRHLREKVVGAVFSLNRPERTL